MTDIILSFWAYDRPGVLDRITGLIRRQNWNISSLTAGDIDQGISQINIALRGKKVDLQRLGDCLDELDGIRSWEVCGPDTHRVRELVMFRINKVHESVPDIEGVTITEKIGNMLYAEFIGTPDEVDRLLQNIRGKMISFVRTGPLVLSLQEESANG